MAEKGLTPSVPPWRRILLPEEYRFWLVGLLICTLGVVVRSIVGPLIIDDGYIYFRYALNAASGNGLIYNQGQPIFGVTSPTYTLILTLAAMLGLDLPRASIFLGIALDLGSSLLLLAIGRKLGSNVTGWVCAVFFAVGPKAVIPGLSGMETSFFTLLITLCLACLVDQRFGQAILLAGLAGATRPEGLALFGVTVGYLAFEERRFRLKDTLLGAAPILAWTAISRIAYQGWIPNSITAKATVFPAYVSPFHDTLLIIRYLTNPFEFTSTTPELGWVNLVVGCLGAVGLVDLVRKSRGTRSFLVWAAIIGAAYAIINRSMFPWYLGPFFPLSSLVLACGLDRLWTAELFRTGLARSFPYGVGVLQGIVIVTLGATFWDASVSAGRVVRVDQDHREAAYLELGRWFDGRLPPDEPIASVEIGAIGYGYPGPILDFTGLVSPEVLPFYAEPGFEFHYPHTVPARAVEQLAPPVLVTYDTYVSEIRSTPWFQRAYPSEAIVVPLWQPYGTLMVFSAPGIPLPP